MRPAATDSDSGIGFFFASRFSLAPSFEVDTMRRTEKRDCVVYVWVIETHRTESTKSDRYHWCLLKGTHWLK